MQSMQFDCKPELVNFHKPVLIIQGMHDVVPVNISAKADSVFPQSKLVLLDSCGHYGWIDQPERYKNAIVQFSKGEKNSRE